MAVIEDLTEEECYLLAILTDHSGLDLAEFSWHEPDEPTGTWRAWSFQWSWFRNASPLQVDQCARSVGKTLSITLRMFAFPFLFPGQEAVVTAPELVHLEPLTNLIERKFYDCRLGREMLPGGRSSVTHRPFMMNFINGARIIGRIPQRDGKGVKGCVHAEAAVWTSTGYKQAKDVEVGDLLLTHTGRYMPVTGVYLDTNDCYEVRGAGSFPMIVSCDHRYYGVENQATSKQKRRFMDLGWHDVDFLLEHQVYWATPIEFPSLPVPDLPLPDSPDLWWLIGRYLADGYLTDNGQALAKVHWVVPDHKADSLILAVKALDLHVGRTKRAHSSADSFSVSNRVFARFVEDHFGRHADSKRLPAWLLGLGRVERSQVLYGYLDGDNQSRHRWEVSSASKELAMGMQLLAQSLGYTVNCTVIQPNVKSINGVDLKVEPQLAWRLQIGQGHSEQIDRYLVGKIKSVVPVGKQPIVDIRVKDDHSYLTGSIMSHNIHPIWLELDEAQDYPSAGWTELIETLKRGHEGAVWRAHGVTRGMRDKFYEYTQDTPDNMWKVHRITAMSRPNWTDQERQEKIQQYKTRDNPDYRRNVLGLHGDATNPLFVLHRLMKIVDEDLSSAYNTDEYHNWRISTEMLHDRGADYEVTEFLDFPAAHRGYAAYWAGMDIGYTKDPSELLIFGEQQKAKVPQIKLLGRIHLERIEAPIQAQVVDWVFKHYNPKTFAMDKMQPVSEPVQTPSGWVSIGSLRLGDKVVGSKGLPIAVTGVYPQVDRRVMKVSCTDGSWTRCGPEHLWTVQGTHRNTQMKVTTEQLATLVATQKSERWMIPMLSAPVQFEVQADPLPLDPYLLGMLLGDGNCREFSTRFSSADPELVLAMESLLPEGMVLKYASKYDYELSSVEAVRSRDGRFKAGRNPVLEALRQLGLAGKHSWDKFLPTPYMTASWSERLALLQGIMDTDGYVDAQPNSCHVGLKISSERLSMDVVSLVESLGGSARSSVQTSSCNGRAGRLVYKTSIAMPSGMSPFRLTRKADRVVPRVRPLRRYVKSVAEDGEEESVCIRVEADDHLYTTRHYLLTHNTGNGLPLFQDLQHYYPKIAGQIKGYNFSEKILVDFDDEVIKNLREGDDDVKEAGMYRQVLEYSTDKLRELVDKEQILLPWDTELIGELQGQTWTYSKSSMDMYGRPRRTFSQGTFHALDAARMAALGFVQYKLEEMMKMRMKQESEPVFDYVMDVF